MRFALDGAKRIEAIPKGRGQCPVCCGDVLAKCGARRIWHWAHRVKASCDQWWENETAWHRNWKMNFPAEWQEVIVKGSSGEIHIADVRTPSGLSIEFQHSPVTDIEQETREEFYNDLILVVDGAHESHGYESFMENIDFWRERGVGAGQIGFGFNPMLANITKRWNSSRRPVLIDFGGSVLWSISVMRDGWAKYALEISKSDFVTCLTQHTDPTVHLSPWK